MLDLITDKSRKDLFPVGRLDKDTEGLLLITNDGDLAHQLLSPKKHVDKVYRARIEGQVTAEDAALFAKGLEIDDEAVSYTHLVSDSDADLLSWTVGGVWTQSDIHGTGLVAASGEY